MYHIIGIDGKEYGPITGEQLKQWIAERRVNAQTKVKEESSENWQPLGALSEFALVLTSTPSRPPPVSAAANPKTSGMAIASLVCSFLGILTCGITALVGLVLGIVALVKIGNSQGRLSGKGLAIGGIVVAGFILLVLPALLLPALARAKGRAQTSLCIAHVKQLSIAMRWYATGHNNMLPEAEHWCDAITNEVGSPQVFQCSTAPDLRCAFAFNAKLSGKKESEVNPETVMFFESNAGWNAAGGTELWSPHQHSGGVTVVSFADSSVQQIKQTELNSLRWDP